MSKARDALGVVAEGLRRSLAEGRIPNGATIGIADTAQTFRTSVTPVREALARLTGEGVLRGTRRLGFTRPRLDASELTELYTFHEALLVSALRLSKNRLVVTAAEGLPTRSAEHVFQAVMTAARNRPLARARGLAALSLTGYAGAEAQVLRDLEGEAAELWTAVSSARPEVLARSVAAYHDRRRNHVLAILEVEVGHDVGRSV